jgi:hypothetical protein
LYGCEELAEMLDAMNCYFVLCCKSDCPKYLFSKLHNKISELGQYKWTARQGTCNIIYALSLWNNPKGKKDKKVNFLFNCGHPDLPGKSGNSNPWVQQFYTQNMGEVDHANQGIHHFNFPHKAQKWTKTVFFAFFQFTLWNATQVCAEKKHHLHSKVLVAEANFLKKPVITQISNTLRIHPHNCVRSSQIAITRGTTVRIGLKTAAGYCQSHSKFFPTEKHTRTSRICLGCTGNALIPVWMCQRCFVYHHFPRKRSKKLTASGARKKFQ